MLRTAGIGEDAAKKVVARYATPAVLWEAYKAAGQQQQQQGGGGPAGPPEAASAARTLLHAELGPKKSEAVFSLLFNLQPLGQQRM